MFKKILNAIFEFLKVGKALGLFKRGSRPEDIVPRHRDPRDGRPLP